MCVFEELFCGVGDVSCGGPHSSGQSQLRSLSNSKHKHTEVEPNSKARSKTMYKNVGWEEEGAEETVVVVVAAVEDVVVSSESKYHQILV